MKDKILSMLGKWSIQNKTISAVVDNEPTMNATTKKLSSSLSSSSNYLFKTLMNIHCLAHILHLTVTKILDIKKLLSFFKTMKINLSENEECELSILSKTVEKCQEIVGHVNHSSPQKKLLEDFQESNNLPKHNLIQQTKTRWNSTLYMIDRIIEQVKAINLLFKDSSNRNHSDKIIKNNEFDILKKLAKTLRPFEKVTKKISGSRYVTCSFYIPAIFTLLEELNVKPDDSNFELVIKSTLRKVLESYMSKYDLLKTDLLLAASFLDPNFKKFSKLPEQDRISNISKAINYILELLPSYEDPIREIFSINNQNLQPPVNEPANDDDYFSDNSRQSKPNNQNLISLVDNLKNEISNYRNESVLGKVEVLEYWDKNKNFYPILSFISTVVLCTPSTSVLSEAAFSHAGYRIRDRRNKIATDKVDQILFIYENYRLVFTE